jgi:putative SOS response-associated peptidase YedK
MCGRFTRMYSWRELVELYKLSLQSPPSNLEPRFNICPTDTIDVIVEHDGRRQLVPMRWGLVPGWWNKKLKDIKLATFNARAESAATKRFFRDAFKQRHCLIPASGYYEWKATPDGKQPYYYTRRDGTPLTFAGLWDEWKNPETGERLRSCTMLITEPNKLAAEIHDRMPAILEPENLDVWLSGEGKDLLVQAADDRLQMWPVSKRMNSSRTPGDDPTLIEEVKDAA